VYPIHSGVSIGGRPVHERARPFAVSGELRREEPICYNVVESDR
jgi:hypothetical protein